MQPQPADTPTGYADLTGFSLRVTPQRKLTFIIQALEHGGTSLGPAPLYNHSDAKY